VHSSKGSQPNFGFVEVERKQSSNSHEEEAIKVNDDHYFRVNNVGRITLNKSRFAKI